MIDTVAVLQVLKTTAWWPLAAGKNAVSGKGGSLMNGKSASMPTTAHVSAARLILTGLGDTEADRTALAERAGVPTSHLTGNATRIPTAYLTRLWQLARKQNSDPLLGLRVAGRWRFGCLHLGDYLFGAACDLAEALSDLVRQAAWFNTAANQIRLTRGADGSATLTYQIRSGDPEVDAVASQFALATQLARAQDTLGRPIRPLHVGLTSAAPARSRDVADGFRAHRLDFGAEASTVTVRPADLVAPLLGADPPLRAVLMDHTERIKGAQVAEPTWSDRLRPVVQARLAGDPLSLPRAARLLAVSSRSLQRRLQEEGTTWRDLVDDVRREYAGALLSHGLTRVQIARRLGFGDARALRAAFRRWESGD